LQPAACKAGQASGRGTRAAERNEGQVVAQSRAQGGSRDQLARFSQPIRQIVLMLIVLVLTGGFGYLIYPSVSEVFLANPYLNGAIGLVFVVGILTCFVQVLQLIVSVNWIEDFVARRPGHEFSRAPRLLASLAALLRDRRTRSMSISTTSARSILESVATRIDEARDITRYIVNLLIFLGLLGTFYGLATTVPAVVDTIRSLAPQEGESGIEVFDKLMVGLEAQLGGMGTAFSSSLLGLAGSLVVGLLELFAGHGQNRFYRELEEWLSGITRLGLASGEGEGIVEQTALVALLDQVVARLEAIEDREATLPQAIADGIAAPLVAAIERLGARHDAASSVADAQLAAMVQLQAALGRDLPLLADGQNRLAAALGSLAERMPDAQIGTAPGGLHDAENRMRLRSIDTQLQRIFAELAEGRAQSTADLRADIAALAAAVRGLGRWQG
jgi:hypothetical protein